MTSLTREQILQAQDIQTVPVEVPEWGGVVYVKTLTALERSTLEKELVEMRANGSPGRIRLEKLRGALVALASCDENGQRLFSEKDIPAIEQKSAAAVDRIVEAAQKAAAMNAGDIDELAGELKNAPPAASPSD